MSKHILVIGCVLTLTMACTKEAPKQPVVDVVDVDGIMAQALDKAVQDATEEAIVAMAKDISVVAMADVITK